MLKNATKRNLIIFFFQITILASSITYYRVYHDEIAGFVYGVAQGYLVLPLIILSPFYKKALFYSTVNSGTDYLIGMAVGSLVWALCVVVNQRQSRYR